MGYIISDELRELKRKAGRLGAAVTNETKASKKALSKVEQQRRLEQNLQFDRELQQDIEQLTLHCKGLPQFIDGTTEEIDYDEWISYVESLLRDCTWDKLPRPYSDRFYVRYTEDDDLPYQDRKYGAFSFPAEACRHLLRKYHHLSPEMIQVLIRTIHAFLAWAGRHEDTLDSEDKKGFIPEIKSGLDRLKTGQDFYDASVVQRIQERLESEKRRVQEEQQKLTRIKTVLNSTQKLPEYIAPDPVVLLELQAKAAAEEKARLDHQEELRRFGVPEDALKYF